ncbi:MAG: hypothetical protein AAF660_15505 [Pseudomonadota bacterium]
MKKLTILLLLLAGNAVAQSLPSYYPSEGFRRTAVIDLVNLDDRTIVLGDSEFKLADTVLVRSLSSQSDSIARLRPGTRVGFRMNSLNQINEIFLLPANYRGNRGR